MMLSIPGMGQRSNMILLLIAVAANLHSANTHQSSTSQDAAVSSFSCVEKVIGGYYADISLGCTMFHVCTLGEKGEIRDIIFKCVPGTLFSQEKRVCEREDEVDCPNSEQFYHLNNELYGPGIIPETAPESAASPGPTPQEVFDPVIALMSAPDPPASSANSPSPENSTSISLAAPVLPLAVPTTSSPPPPPTVPPGVTASTSRMSASTSASINFSYPSSLPFTVSKTFSSTSVSASSRVHIKTGISDFTFNHGPTIFNQSHLPAPHLRPSLLRHAVQNQAIYRDHTPPDTVTSQTPFDFQDIPRLTTESSRSSSHAFHTRSKRQTLSNISNTKRRQTVGSNLNLNSPGRQNFVSSRGIRRQQTQPKITQGQTNSQSQTIDSNNRQVTSRRQQTRPPLRTTTIIDSGQNTHDTEPQKTIVETVIQPSLPSRKQRIRRPQLRNPSHTQAQNRDLHNNNRQNIQSLNLDANINSNSAGLVPNNNNHKLKTFNIDQENKVNDNKNIQESLALTGSDVNNSNPFSLRAQNKNVAQLNKNKSQTLVPISSNNPRLRPIVRKTVRVGLDRIKPSEFNRQHSVFNSQQSIFNSQQSAFRDISHDIPVTPDVSRPLTLTNQFPPDRTIVNNGSEHSQSIRTENIAPIVTTTQQPPIQFAPTSFTCVDKIHGGLYADVETGCSVFHICSVEPDGSSRSSRFVCGTGTLFDQKTRTCSLAAAVDCGRSPSLYYLNEPFQSPVLLEFEAEFPEQQFDFPRVPQSSPSSSSFAPNSFTHSRVRRDKDGEVDLCRTRPVGTPLADITTSCQEYTVCEISEGKIVERRYPCKKGQVFSQLHRKCLSEKKVKCAKETLNEILGLGTMRDTAGQVLNRRKRGPRSLLHSYRFRRAALPPLTNLVLTPGVQDARVRRALFNLAALQQWAQENAHHTSFIEVYTLHSREKNNYYPKKINQERSYQPHSENNNYHTYSYVQRRKRQAMLEDATLIGKSDIVSQSVTSTGISPAKVQSHKLHTTTVGKPSPVVNASVITKTATVTTTTTLTVNPTSATAKLEEPTAPAIVDPATKIISSTKVTQPLLITYTHTNTGESQVTKTANSQASPTATLLTGNDSASSIAPNPVTTPISITAIITTSTTITPALEILSTSEPTTTTKKTLPVVTEQPPKNTSNNEAPIYTTKAKASNETMLEIPVIGTNDTTASMENGTSTTVTEKTTTTTASTTSTSTTTVSSVPTVTSTPIPVSTETPTTVGQQSTSTETSVTKNVTGTTVTSTPIPPSTPKPITSDTLPETNFTCKDKTLEKFYPDTEANCQVFHYCSPGFTKEQVLDIKFLCTNETMFDVVTQKCENKENVECEKTPPTTIAPPTTTENITTTSTTLPPTTTPTTLPPTTTPTTLPPTPPTTTTPTTTPPPLPPTTATTTTTTTIAPPQTTTENITTPSTTLPPPTTTPTTTTTTQITTSVTTKAPIAVTTTIPATNTTEPQTTLETNTATTEKSFTLPISSKTPQVNTINEDVTTDSFSNITEPDSEIVNQTITTPLIEVVTDNNIETLTTSQPDIKTSRENIPSTTTVEPTDEDIVTELGPTNPLILTRELPLQQTESPSPKDSTNTEAEALTSVSSTESISRSTSSETSNSPSVSISSTQLTQSAR